MSDDEEYGLLYHRDLPDGFEVAVLPLNFGRASLSFGKKGEDSYSELYRYARPELAIEAAKTWSGRGDPLDGWYHHPKSGRRRTDGDPAREYVHF